MALGKVREMGGYKKGGPWDSGGLVSQGLVFKKKWKAPVQGGNTEPDGKGITR